MKRLTPALLPGLRGSLFAGWSDTISCGCRFPADGAECAPELPVSHVVLMCPQHSHPGLFLVSGGLGGCLISGYNATCGVSSSCGLQDKRFVAGLQETVGMNKLWISCGVAGGEVRLPAVLVQPLGPHVMYTIYCVDVLAPGCLRVGVWTVVSVPGDCRGLVIPLGLGRTPPYDHFLST